MVGNKQYKLDRVASFGYSTLHTASLVELILSVCVPLHQVQSKERFLCKQVQHLKWGCIGMI